MEVVTRSEAKAKGLSRYFTGKPCPRGHLALKSTKWKYCMECQRERSLEKIQANPEMNRKKVLEWQKANRKRASERANAWYHANKEKARASCAAYEAANIDKVRATRHRIRAQRANAEGVFEASDIQRILTLQKGKCALCKCKITPKNKSIDHIIALFNGGSNHPRNLQILCLTCNLSKGARDPIDHAQRKGLLL